MFCRYVLYILLFCNKFGFTCCPLYGHTNRSSASDGFSVSVTCTRFLVGTSFALFCLLLLDIQSGVVWFNLQGVSKLWLVTQSSNDLILIFELDICFTTQTLQMRICAWPKVYFKAQTLFSLCIQFLVPSNMKGV